MGGPIYITKWDALMEFFGMKFIIPWESERFKEYDVFYCESLVYTSFANWPENETFNLWTKFHWYLNDNSEHED